MQKSPSTTSLSRTMYIEIMSWTAWTYVIQIGIVLILWSTVSYERILDHQIDKIWYYLPHRWENPIPKYWLCRLTKYRGLGSARTPIAWNKQCAIEFVIVDIDTAQVDRCTPNKCQCQRSWVWFLNCTYKILRIVFFSFHCDWHRKCKYYASILFIEPYSCSCTCRL